MTIKSATDSYQRQPQVALMSMALEVARACGGIDA
jgi:hypothetical protein